MRATLRVVVFALLLFFPVFAVCFRIGGGAVQDPDVWWHLRTADWIEAHAAVPHFDPFAIPRGDDGGGPQESGAAAPEHGTPWVDYSWAAQLVVGAFHRALGLRGLVVYTALLVFSIVLAFHVLVRHIQQNLLLSGVLTMGLCVGILPLATPRPWLFSLLFFVLELQLLLEAGRTARPRLLLLLVPLFWVWANVHIQFTWGLLVLALAVVEPLLARRAPLVLDGESVAISPRWLLLVFVLCCGATLLNPYHVQLYTTAVQLLGQAELWNYIQELKAMTFRTVPDWVVLGAALAGTAAIAARRPVRLLLVLLFPLAVYCGFRSTRDQWLVLIVGLSLAASASRGLPVAPVQLTTRNRWAVAALLAVLALGSLATLNEGRLSALVAQEYPAQAVAFLQQGPYPGPLFNTYNWGGYLIYHYPEHAVSMDGRTLVYGTARVVHSTKLTRGEEGWQSDPELAAAGLLILPRKEPLTLLLRLDGRLQVAYEDDVAVVFTRRQSTR